MSALEKPLDGAGLAVVNQIINERLNKKQDALTAGYGTSISGDAINVITPVRGVFTQTEYNALPEAEKSSGMYIISDGNDASIPPGGTTGQAIVKTGADDYATGWKTLTASDVDARPSTWTPSAADVGAATMEQVNAAINAAITGAMEASY